MDITRCTTADSWCGGPHMTYRSYIGRRKYLEWCLWRNL